jgi:RND family efflux transporter MFP subunit
MRPDPPQRASLFPVLSVLLVVFALACGREPDQPAPPRSIEAPKLKILAEEVIECRGFPAQVEARNSVTLASKFSGTVLEVFAQEGASLKAGELILRVDDKDLLSREQGFVASMSQANLERQALAAKSAHAKANLDRLEKLAAQKVISQDDYERAKSEHQALKREEEAISAREKSVAFQREELQSLKGYTRINAPFDGVLTKRYVDRGAFVTAGQPLALVDDVAGGFDVTAQVDESLLSSLRVGQDIVARVPGVSSDPFIAKVSAVIGRVDPSSRTFKLKVAIPDAVLKAGKPSAGMFGRVFAPARSVKKLLAPASCLAKRGDLPLLFALDEQGIIHLRVVKTGGVFFKVRIGDRTYLTDSEAFEDSSRERFVEVFSGLAEGERLACGKTETLREGDRIVEARQ